MSEMQTSVGRRLLGVAAAVAVAVLTAGALSLSAQAPAPGTGGPGEKIAVRGHWKIDVRQPNGDLVTHTEFDNAFFDTGGVELTNTLARRRAPAAWEIDLQAISSSACGPAAGPGAPCVIVEPGFVPLAGSNVFKNVTMDPTGLVLRGTATAERVGRIDVVFTRLWSCNAGTPASTCAFDPTVGAGIGRTSVVFSGHNLSPPIDVVAGQVIEVEVTYSFSAGGTTVSQ
ncbi:MAG: hypothetical protein ABI665_06245 [Vicinamibacterales bacterium]